MNTEEEVIKNIQSGVDVEKGFKFLVQLYQEKIYWHIRSIMKSHEDTNDVMQNTFIKAYKNINSFKNDAKFYTWLYRIATNESLNALKKNNKIGVVGMDEPEGIMKEVHSDPYFDGDEAQIILLQAIASLPEKQRLVFNMKYYDDMSYKDISEILNTSVGALKASFHHASKKIEAFVKSMSYE